MNFSVLQPVFPEFNRIIKNLKLYHSFICQPASFDLVVIIVVTKFVGIWQHIFGKIAWHCKENRSMSHAVYYIQIQLIFKNVKFCERFILRNVCRNVSVTHLSGWRYCSIRTIFSDQPWHHVGLPFADNQSLGWIFSAVRLADDSYKISKLDISINGKGNLLWEDSSIPETNSETHFTEQCTIKVCDVSARLVI